MKRTGLWLLAALVLGALAGQLMIEDPGYLLLRWQGWVVEASLWTGALLVGLLFVALLVALGVANALLDLAGTIRHWRDRRRQDRARALMDNALAQLAGADWRRATSTLLKAVELVDTPLLARFAAARAAEADGRADLAAQVLREARSRRGAPAALVDLELAGLHARQGELAEARLLLARLHARTPAHQDVLRQYADVCTRLGDWQALAGLLPALQAVLPAGDWLALARRAGGSLLASVAGEAGYASRKARHDALQAAWKSLPPALRADAVVTGAYVDALVAQGAGAEARAVLERAIGDAPGGAWDDALVARYGRLDADKPEEQLAAAEQWLLMRPTHPALLLALGRISLRNRLWGKARDYFEASVAREPTAEGCAELARLYARLGETAKAELALRRQGELTGRALPDLPLPTARV